MEIDGSKPIWLQIVEDLQRRIVVGQWAPGTRIPSVRELATQIGVNPNTVQRALVELDRTGLTAVDRTSGRFVTADHDVVDAARRELAADATTTFIATVTGLGFDLPGATRLLSDRWPSDPSEEPGENS